MLKYVLLFNVCPGYVPSQLVTPDESTENTGGQWGEEVSTEVGDRNDGYTITAGV